MKIKAASGTMFTLVLLAGILTLTFNIQPARAGGAIHIKTDGSVDPPDAPIQRDGNVYTLTDDINDFIFVERNDIVVDGACHAVQIYDGPPYCIYLSRRSNVTIKNFEVKSFFKWGIKLEHSSNNTILGNNITRSQDGIYLHNSSNNIISGNSVAHIPYFTVSFSGIYLDISSNNTISKNNITSNRSGIVLGGSHKNSIYGNNINANKGDGIALVSSSNNRIFRNNITSNGGGIELKESLKNSVSGNNITNNEVGVELNWSFENIIYHNNFINNTQQVYDRLIERAPSTNVWDNGTSGGNYWSDYEERCPNAGELDSSGIWDTLYVVDDNNIDNYPLVRPWSTGWSPSWNLEPPIEDFPFWTQGWLWAIVTSVTIVSAGAVYAFKKRLLAFAALRGFYFSVLLASYLLALFYPFSLPYCWFVIPAVTNFFVGYLTERVDAAAKIIIVGFSLQAGVLLILLNFSPFYDAFLSMETLMLERISIDLLPTYYDDLSLMLAAIIFYWIANVLLGIPVSLAGIFVKENNSKIVAAYTLLAQKIKKIKTLLNKVRR